MQKLLNRIKGLMGIRPKRYVSETSKVRYKVLRYCQGYGCDVGFGGDKIKVDAIGIDLPRPYANTGRDKVDIACDLAKERIPVVDSTYDYVYSSHLIEDFYNTEQILWEFVRVLKPGGTLTLVFPDQIMYEGHCIATKQPINKSHVHPNMGLNFMRSVLHNMWSGESNVGFDCEELYISNCEIDYNVILVLKIFK